MKYVQTGYKRIIAAAFFLCMAFAISACMGKKRQFSSDTADDSHTEHSKESVIEKAYSLLPQKLIKVGFVQVGHESDWRIAATKSCRETFSEENGYRLYFVDADNDPKVQVDAVRNFIKDQVDYIVIDPILTTGWTAVLKEAYHAGIPVILIDRTIDCDERYYVAWYGSDFVREGEYAGQWLQNYLNRNGRNDEIVRIVAINGTQGASAQIGRTEGFARYLKRNKNWHLLAQECGDFTENGGRMVMEQYLETYADIDVVICQNDNEAFGACAALEEAGISYGKDGDVIILSFDATRAGLEAVMDGKINADFECNPLSAPYVARAIRMLQGGMKLTEKKRYLPEDCFTAEDVPMVLVMEYEVKKMIPVTEDLLKERAY